MLDQVFSSQYADIYDYIYSDKDYIDECNKLESIFNQYGNNVKRVLDVGCGTGNHALILAERKYDLVGIDRSSDMIQIAKRKSKNYDNLEFHVSDILKYKSNKPYNAVVMMFAVMGYINKNELIQKSIDLISQKLTTSGLFIFDFWYGPAVLYQRPTTRLKKIQHNNYIILRYAEPTLDEYNQCCNVKYITTVLDGKNLLDNFEENHTVRFFFPKEIELFLNTSNFELMDFKAFPDIEKKPDVNCWNTICIAKKKK